MEPMGNFSTILRKINRFEFYWDLWAIVVRIASLFSLVGFLEGTPGSHIISTLEGIPKVT
jgi:hypothetical protein